MDRSGASKVRPFQSLGGIVVVIVVVVVVVVGSSSSTLSVLFM